MCCDYKISMGDIAEYYASHQIDDEINASSMLQQADDMMEHYKIGDLEWHPKDSKPVLVTHMTNEHVVNAHKFLEKNDFNDPRIQMWIQIFKIEKRKRKL